MLLLCVGNASVTALCLIQFVHFWFPYLYLFRTLSVGRLQYVIARVCLCMVVDITSVNGVDLFVVDVKIVWFCTESIEGKSIT